VWRERAATVDVFPESRLQAGRNTLDITGVTSVEDQGTQQASIGRVKGRRVTREQGKHNQQHVARLRIQPPLRKRRRDRGR
jgi:hypothetical protein